MLLKASLILSSMRVRAHLTLDVVRGNQWQAELEHFERGITWRPSTGRWTEEAGALTLTWLDRTV